MNASATPPDSGSPATLAECLLARSRHSDPHPGVEEPTAEQAADRLLAESELRAAAEAYASLPSSTSHTRAKQGWCLIWLGDVDEGRLLLEPEAVGGASAELVARAVLLADGWDGKHLRRGFSGRKAQEDRKERLDNVLGLLRQAIEAEPPDVNAFDLMERFGEWPYTARNETLAMVEGWLSRTDYVGLRVWRARLLRLMGKTTQEVVQELLEYSRSARDAGYFQELFESARECGRLDVARNVLKFLREAAGADMSHELRHDLAMLDADLTLQAIRTGEGGDPRVARQQLVEARAALSAERLDNPQSYAFDLLLIIEETRGCEESRVRVSEAAAAFLSSLEKDEHAGLECIGNAFPASVTSEEYFSGTVRLGFSASLIDVAPVVQSVLDGEHADRWRLATLIYRNETEEALSSDEAEELLTLGEGGAPRYRHQMLLGVALGAEMTGERAARAGRLFAKSLIYEARAAFRSGSAELPDEVAGFSPEILVRFADGLLSSLQELDAEGTQVLRSEVLDCLAQALIDAKLHLVLQRAAEDATKFAPSVRARFFAGYASQMLNERTKARVAYEAVLAEDPRHTSATRNLLIILDQQGDLDAIQGLLPHVVAMADSDPTLWKPTLELARSAEKRAKAGKVGRDLREKVAVQLADFPPLTSQPVDIGELSLIEAAHLVALIRACDLDHETWTLKPFDRSSTPFDPTNFMRSALFSLVRRGVVTIAESSPLSAFTLTADGDVSYRLGEVEWRITPETIELRERIRKLSRRNWPTSWQRQLPVVARDLAVEECVAYAEHLCERRRMTPPERADLRVLFREMIETTAVTRCWGFIWMGVASANDYKSQYPATQKHIATRMLNQIREKWERGMAEGWGNSYKRPATLQRSQIAIALHDVLTGWRERAFESMLSDLVGEDETDAVPPSGTVH